MKYKVRKVVTSEYEVEAENAERAKFNIEEFGNLKATNAKVSAEEVREDTHLTIDLLNEFIELSNKQLEIQRAKTRNAADEAFAKLHAHWEEIRKYVKNSIAPIITKIHIGYVHFGDYGIFYSSCATGDFWRVCKLKKNETDIWQHHRSTDYQNIEHELQRSSLHVYNWLFELCANWEQNRILLEKELAKHAQVYFDKQVAETNNTAAYYIKEGQKL